MITIVSGEQWGFKSMHQADQRAIRKLRAKLFANMAVMEAFCHYLRDAMEQARDIEPENLSDRDFARMAQQWLGAADGTGEFDGGAVAPGDVAASFRILTTAAERLLDSDFTMEERRALQALEGELTTRVGRTAHIDPPGFWDRFRRAMTT